MSKLFFAESKLIFKKGTPEQSNNAEQAAEGIQNETYRDTREAQQVMLEQSKLRSRLNSSDVLTDGDKANWNRRLEEAKARAISAEEMQEMTQEFDKQHGEIKRVTDTLTRKVLDNKKEAYTEKSAEAKLKNIKEKMTHEEKMKALAEIDAEIDELIGLRQKLVSKFDKKEVYQMEKEEMLDKVKQLEKIEENIKTYKNLIKGDERLFHNPDQYVTEFEDLTPQEQTDWIRRFKDEIAKPRQEVVDIYDKIPSKYQNDAKFFKVGLKGKQEFLNKLDVKIEQEYLKKVNNAPVDVMSQNSKKFALVDFLRLKDVSEKAMWLEQLPKSIKAEQKLTKDYKNPKFKEVRKLETYTEKQWEKLRFEEKEKLLKNMEVELKLMEIFSKILKDGEKDKAISEKTKGRYEEIYAATNINGRSQLCRNILMAMKVRRDLVDDFEKLDDETQKKFASFYKRGHKARLQLLKEAVLFDKKLEKEDDAEEEKNPPEALESEDIEEIIAKFHKEADKFEAQGEYERCLDKHNSVLKLHPENTHSKKKQKELQQEAKTVDSLLDDDIQDAIEREANLGSIQEEIERLRLSKMLLEDRDEAIRRNKGVEDLGKQTAHLRDDSFDRDVQRKIYEDSGRKQMLDKDGKITDVEQVDLSMIGKRDKSDIRKYREKLRDRKKDENLANIQLVDEHTGRELRIDEAKQEHNKGKMAAAKQIANQIKGLSPAEANAVLLAASDLIDDQVEDYAT